MAEVIGAIRDTFLRLGGERFTGPALDVERPTFDSVGRTQTFQNGVTISWHPEIGAFAVVGLIREKWLSLGREQFGYPVTDELGTPNGRGRFNHFRTLQALGDPEASIYFTPQTGAHEVRGAIRAAWAAAGFERSTLGFPTSDEFGAPTHRRSNFEHGFIEWTPHGGPVVHGPVPFGDDLVLNPVDG